MKEVKEPSEVEGYSEFDTKKVLQTLQDVYNWGTCYLSGQVLTSGYDGILHFLNSQESDEI